MRCWGFGFFGQLGSGATTNLLDGPGQSASTVPLGEPATQVSAGEHHTCALTQSGAVRCWGTGSAGRLGNGSNEGLLDGFGESASTVPLGETATQVSAGGDHTCALTQSGAVRCWGEGSSGELGSGATADLLDGPGESASTVPLGEPATQVSAGADHTCALTLSGAVRCWGAGGSGRLGNASNDSLLDGPGESASTVPLGEPATQVSAGSTHTCALTLSGAVRCWGVGFPGQLGSGAIENLLDGPGESASTVPLGEPATQVSAAGQQGGSHTCALTQSGAVRCWGSGASGRLGSGATANLLDGPGESASTVPLGEPATRVSAGATHTCALTLSGAVRCWGVGASGRLGSGATANLLDGPGESASTVPLS